VTGAGLGVLSTLLVPSHCPGVHKRVHRRRKRRGRQEVNKKPNGRILLCYGEGLRPEWKNMSLFVSA